MIKKIIMLISLLIGGITICFGIYFSILPKLYLGLLIGGYVFVEGIILVLLKRKNKIGNIIGILLTIILVIISVGIDFIFIRSDQILSRITKFEKEVTNYAVIVLKESNYTKIDDIKNKEIGVLKDGTNNYKDALGKLKKEGYGNYKDYSNALELANGLLIQDVSVIFLEENYISILDEGILGFEDKIKILYTVKIEQESTVSKVDDVNPKKQAFNIYISGIDTYGGISTVSRSDVNIIATVNPNTSKILLTNVPRDMYVPLAGRSGLRDKLTHAGVYGIDTSIATLENFLDTDINYYVRINFNSLISLVDYIGGIDIYSDYDFRAGNRNYYKGMNYNLTGKEALAFSRNRYAFHDGDRQRGRNQEKVIEAIIGKVTSSRDINTYLNMISTLENSFQTNMSKDTMQQFVQQQLEFNYQWSVEATDVNGYDHMDYTYSYPWQKLYVMLVDENSLSNAKMRIQNALEEK